MEAYSLRDLKREDLGNQFQIIGFSGDSVTVSRLGEMGLRVGLRFVYQGRAPFSGPMLFKFGNTVLALREEEAACARVVKA